MKGSKLLLVLLLFSSTFLFAQEKKIHVQYGIGVNHNNINFFRENLYDLSTIKIKYKYSSIGPFFSIGNNKFNQEIGFFYIPQVKENFHFNDIWGDIYETYQYHSQLCFNINNGIKIFHNTHINLGASLIFQKNSDSLLIRNFKNTHSINMGLTYYPSSHFSIFLSGGYFFITNGLKSGKQYDQLHGFNFNTHSIGLSLGLKYFIKSHHFNTKINTIPNKTYQF